MLILIMQIQTSHDQKTALERLMNWWTRDHDYQYVTLGGYAGTGKTTLISIFRKQLYEKDKKLKVTFASYTGKATRVLTQKLKELDSIYKNDEIGTIHSLIYSPQTNSKGEIIGWEIKTELKCDLIIIDEASMVDEKIWNDLLYFKIPIIAVGDHGQLPPINGNFNLMEKPMIKLEEIHRQAKENPIINLSIEAREKGKIDPGYYAGHVIKVDKSDQDTQPMVQELLESYSSDMLVLCGYNWTRIELNKQIRAYRYFESPEPKAGDRVICLKNNHQKEIYNGMLGSIFKIESIQDGNYYAEIEMDGEDKMFRGLISAEQFGNEKTLISKKGSELNLFDFGYAMTVHKAQGSQAKRVVLFEQRFGNMTDDEWRKWLYTAVTRAEQELYIIG